MNINQKINYHNNLVKYLNFGIEEFQGTTYRELHDRKAMKIRNEILSIRASLGGKVVGPTYGAIRLTNRK